MTLDELLAAVSAELRAIGLRVAPESPSTDANRAGALLGAGEEIRTTGRRLFLRLAARFAGRAFEARAGGDIAEASRWAERAEAELDRYLEPAPELHPYVATGGAQ